MVPHLQVLGAAGEVTGSSYLLTTAEGRWLIDCGLFQGGAAQEAKNRAEFAFAPQELTGVILTHAHLDHCGRLPLLEAGGFRGPIYATGATRELAGLILRDSARVQAADVERENRKRQRAGRELLAPLYGAEGVERTLQLFREIAYGEVFEPGRGLCVRMVEAGHMLGSASVEIRCKTPEGERVIVFSGDLGPRGLAVVRDSEFLDRADWVVMESTYGDRDNRSPTETLAEFRGILETAVREKTRLLVPSFAVGRSQQLLFHVEELFSTGEIGPFPVYLDSPMAIEATEIYRRHPDLFDEETKRLGRTSPFTGKAPYLHICAKADDSRALNKVEGPCLIMAGAGMCTGGRILHHLKHGLWREDTAVLFVGYQAEGSLGRRLVEGEKTVRIMGEEVGVRAQIHTLNGFSAHAAQTALLAWLEPLVRDEPTVLLTHGEDRARRPLAEKIRERFGLIVECPAPGEEFEIS
jgi:metallo-beta-lactamase family protein